jgi:hypothetical protein
MGKPRAPVGLGPAGEKLFKDVTGTFDFEDEPAKLALLAQACRVADIIAELDEHAAEAPLTVKGSAGQQVIQPTLAEARFQRGLLAQLLGRLGLPENNVDEDELAEHRARRSAAGRAAAHARWNRGY